jgi:hypothetical protein
LLAEFSLLSSPFYYSPGKPEMFLQRPPIVNSESRPPICLFNLWNFPVPAVQLCMAGWFRDSREKA